jgi:tetratricopeptide (TPR) repeat protein
MGVTSAILTEVRAAWMRGDFESCIGRLAEIGDAPLSLAERTEALLLRGRSLQRLRRGRELVELIEPVLGTIAAVDESSTARMLHAAGLLLDGKSDAALRLLGEVATFAARRHAHRAIRAEIAYTRALANWTKRDLVAADRFARDAEAAHADVISVRAAQLRGFIALSQRRYPDALKLFTQAMDAYRLCIARDAFLAETIAMQMASLELTLRSATVTGTHTRRAVQPFSGSETSLALLRTQAAIQDAWLFAHDGAAEEAYRKISAAEDLAPSPAWRAWVLADRALIASAFGERIAAPQSCRARRSVRRWCGLGHRGRRGAHGPAGCG